MIHKFVRRLFAYKGNVYVWGQSPNYIGVPENLIKQAVGRPVEIEGFGPNTVKQVSLSDNHGAIVTEDGQVYTFGKGSYGALGHDNEKRQVTPTLIESLAKIDIKVSDAAVGE